MFFYLLKHKFIVSLFITSFIPLWISIFLIEVFSILDNKNFYRITEYIVMTAILFVNLICIVYLKFKITKIKANNKEPKQILKSVFKEKAITTEYFLSYVLPLFTFNFTQWKDILLFLIFFFTLGFLCIKNRNVYSNIVLEAKKYNFYTCNIQNLDHIDSDVLIISKRNLSNYVNSDISFARIDEGVLIDTTSATF